MLVGAVGMGAQSGSVLVAAWFRVVTFFVLQTIARREKDLSEEPIPRRVPRLRGSRAAFLAEVWRVARPRRGNGEAGASSAGDAQRLEPCLRYNCRRGGTWLVAFTMFGVGIVATTGRV